MLDHAKSFNFNKALDRAYDRQKSYPIPKTIRFYIIAYEFASLNPPSNKQQRTTGYFAPLLYLFVVRIKTYASLF